MFPMDQLHELFPLPCESFSTAGIGDGVILKFRTFYLKIYDRPKDGAYLVQGFTYNKRNPLIIDHVPWTQMRKYAEQFNKEDYLQELVLLHAQHN